METAFPRYRNRERWKTLYRAAILETDKKMVAQRMPAAEAAVLARGPELFYTPRTAEELEALDDALYASGAFKSACRIITDEGLDIIH
jgi:hypothetical protein